MTKFSVSLSAFNAYLVEVEASTKEEAEEKVLNIWRNDSSFDWNKALYDTTELFVDNVEEIGE